MSDDVDQDSPVPPGFCDRLALELHRNRARKHLEPAMFLHDEALFEFRARLECMDCELHDVGIVTGYPDYWSRAFPGAVIVPDKDELDFSPGTFGLIINALTLHWANDPIGQLVQCRLALRAGGLMLASLLGGSTLTELRTAMAIAETEVMGGISPRVAPMGEIRALGSLLQRAGFNQPVADRICIDASYRSTLDLCRDLRAMGETNALRGRLRQTSRKALFGQLELRYRDRFPRPDGSISATFELIFLTGWAASAVPDFSRARSEHKNGATAK